MSKILVIGSFMTDLVVQTDKLPVEGETRKGISFHQFNGGKGANQAVQAARMGADVTMYGHVGDDLFGSAHIRGLKQEQIGASRIRKDSEKPTGVGNVMLEGNGNNRIVIIPGANDTVSKEDIHDIEDLIIETEIVVLQFEIPMEAVQESMKLAKKHNKLVIVNPAPAQIIPDEYLSMVDFLIPNETELGVISGKKELTTQSEIESAVKVVLEKGVQNVIVTLGSKGSVYRNQKNESIDVSPRKVIPIDTTAAGDSFIGAFAATYGKTKDIKHSLEIANLASSITVTRLGAQPSLPNISEIEKMKTEEATK